MHLFVFIVVSTILAYILIALGGPFGGGILALGIVLGCLFRAISLLNEINDKIPREIPKSNEDDNVNER